MQSLLESLHTDHVLCEFESLSLCLDGELSVEKKIILLTVPEIKPQPVIRCPNLYLYDSRYHSPSIIKELLLFCNVAFITHGQILHDYLSILLIRLPNGSFVRFKLDDIYNFV